MVEDNVEIQISHIIHSYAPSVAVKALVPIFKELRYQAKQSDEVSQKLALQIKQMEQDKIQIQLDYDKLLMRITSVELAPSK